MPNMISPEGKTSFFHPIDLKHALAEGWKEVTSSAPAVAVEVKEEPALPLGASIAGVPVKASQTAPEPAPAPTPAPEPAPAPEPVLTTLEPSAPIPATVAPASPAPEAKAKPTVAAKTEK